MDENKYKNNIIMAIVSNVISLFIFGYIFSGIAYYLFDKNYKCSLEDRKKRNDSIIGKSISSFFIFMSLSYHSQPQNSIEDRTIASCIIGFICSIICFFILRSKDKKI